MGCREAGPTSRGFPPLQLCSQDSDDPDNDAACSRVEPPNYGEDGDRAMWYEGPKDAAAPVWTLSAGTVTMYLLNQKRCARA